MVMILLLISLGIKSDYTKILIHPSGLILQCLLNLWRPASHILSGIQLLLPSETALVAPGRAIREAGTHSELCQP